MGIPHPLHMIRRKPVHIHATLYTPGSDLVYPSILVVRVLTERDFSLTSVVLEGRDLAVGGEDVVQVGRLTMKGMVRFH